MKIKHLFLTLLAVATVAVSCKKEDTGKASLEISPAELSFEATASTQSVSVTSNRDWKIESESSLPSWIKVTKVSASEATVSVEANTGNDRSQDVVFRVVGVKRTLSVSQKGEKGAAQEGDGTEANPYTASQAYEAAAKLGTDATSDAEVYVTGTVSSITEISTSYGNATFKISDDGTTASTQFTVFQCLYVGGVKFTEATKDAIKVGDVVVVKGYLVNYKGDTPELQKKGQLISVNGKVPEEGETPDYTKAEAKTVAEFIAAANKTTYYKLTGTISDFTIKTNDSNEKYFTFTLTDNSGSILVYRVNNQADYIDKLANGYKVVVAGKYYVYNTTHEVVDAYILSYEAAKAETTTVTGLVVAVSGRGFLIKTDDAENNGIKYIYDSSETPAAPTVKVGQNVTVTGTVDSYGDTPEITAYTVTSVNSSDNTVTYPEAVEITKDNAASTAMFTYVKLNGKLTINASKGYHNVSIDGSSYTGSLVNLTDDISVLDGKYIDVEGYFVGISYSIYNILTTKIAEAAIQPKEETPGEGSIILTFPDDNKEKNKVGGYDKTWTATTGTTSFSIVNFNNNNWNNSWTYIKCGSSKAASVASIATASAIATKIDKVVVTLDKYDASKVNSAKLYVASKADFSDAKTSDLVYANGLGTMTVATPAANMYYKVVFDCKTGSGNGFVQVSKVILWVNAAE